ncbi:MAG: 50S ribosomal protein L10 [Nanoarchaeota archaeon]|nr:50S ribosomal protein L10 [Nanoarchaeota archaeon]
MTAEKKHKAHIADDKKTEVKELVKLLKEYPIIGIVDLENLPSAQFQKIKKQLSSMMLVRMSKLRLIKIAFEQVKDNFPGIEELSAKIKGMPAVIFTKENPFRLAKAMNKSKSTVPIKAGQKAPYDLIIPAGPTPFAPGPILSELGAAGIKAGIEGGKVAVKAEKVVAKEGVLVDNKTAGLLAKFGIEPMEIGLNLVAVLENGIVLTNKVLFIDEAKTKADIAQLAAEAMNLAVYIAYPSEGTIKLLVAKAHREARAIASSQDILTDDNLKEILAKAESQASSVKSKAGL